MNCALSGLKVPSLKRSAPPTAHAINRAVTEAFGCISRAAASEATKPEMGGATQMLISWHARSGLRTGVYPPGSSDFSTICSCLRSC